MHLAYGVVPASLGALASLAAFACDIALFVFVRHEINSVDGVEASIEPGIGVYMLFCISIHLFID